MYSGCRNFITIYLYKDNKLLYIYFYTFVHNAENLNFLSLCKNV